MVKRFGRVDTMPAFNNTARWSRQKDGSLLATINGVAFKIDGLRLYVMGRVLMHQDYMWCVVAESDNVPHLKRYAREYANKEPWTYESDL